MEPQFYFWILLGTFLPCSVGCSSKVPQTLPPSDLPGMRDRAIECVRTESGLLVQHVMGATRIDTKPLRICALAFADESLALGVKPIAAAARHGLFPDYMADQLEGSTPVNQMLDVAEPDFECLANCQLDLILASDVTRQTYDRLAKIAPTIIMKGDSDNNRQRILDLGMILNRQIEAQDCMEKYDRILALAKEELHARIGNDRVAFFRIWGKQFYIHGHTRGGIMLYDELGLRPPSLIDSHPRGCALNPESLLLLDADILFVATEANLGAERSWTTLLEHPVWQQVPAAKRGKVYALKYQQHWLRAGFQAKLVMLKEILSALHPTSQALQQLRDWTDQNALAL